MHSQDRSLLLGSPGRLCGVYIDGNPCTAFQAKHGGSRTSKSRDRSWLCLVVRLFPALKCLSPAKKRSQLPTGCPVICSTHCRDVARRGQPLRTLLFFKRTHGACGKVKPGHRKDRSLLLGDRDPPCFAWEAVWGLHRWKPLHSLPGEAWRVSNIEK
jgi:hypothetical protein